MRGRSLALYLTAAVGLWVVIPLPASAVPTCPTNAVCIDESIQNADPTVTSTSPLFDHATIIPAAFFLVTWRIEVFMRGDFVSFGTPQRLILTEPGTGDQSDALASIGVAHSNPARFDFDLAADNDTGAPIFNFCAPSVACAVEDGMFQLAISGMATTEGSFDVYLKSDLDSTNIPEPASLALLVGAFAGLGLLRGRLWAG